jgi:alpha-glucosidase (family GH31 glycosyl hydrolase)
MQMHRGVQAGSLTDTNNLEQYPWGYGNTALANYVTYSKLHSQLFPYIYSYAKQASTDGLPLIRPMVLLNQTDPTMLGVQHTFYFGNELLVAPMNAATSTSRNIQLPAGNWYDYWTNKRLRGGQTITASAPIDTLPLFVRAGSIVPLGSTVLSASDPQSIASVRVYPGADGDFTLFADDGNTYGYENGTGSITKLHWDNVSQKLKHQGAAAWSGPDSKIVVVVHP